MTQVAGFQLLAFTFKENPNLTITCLIDIMSDDLGPLILTWFNLNPSIDK